MATFTTTKRTSYGTIDIVVTASTGSVTTNTTPISVSLNYTSSGQYYMGVTDFDIVDSQGNYLIDSYTRSYGVVSGISKGTVTIKSWSNLTAYHEDDGTGSLTITINYRIGNTTVNTDTFTMTLSTIARASSLAIGSTSLAISSTSGTLSYTITPKANFYHELVAKISSSSTVYTGTISSATSGTIAYSTILALIPSASSGTLTLTLTTYSDSNKTTTIGTSTQNCSVSVSIKPTISSLALTEYGTDLSVFVAGYSKGYVTCTTSKPSGASSVTTYISCSGSMSATTSSTATSVAVYTSTLPSSTSNSTLTVSVYAIDSRGNTSSTSTTTATVYGYTAPVISANFYRVADSSSTTEDEAGTYVYGTFDSSVTSLSGNTITTTATFNGTTITTGSHNALAETSTATIVVTATDLVTSVSTTIVIPVAIYAVDIYDAGSGDVGFAVGGISRSGYNDNFLIGTGDYYYDTTNGSSIDLCSDGNVILMGIAGSTSSVAVTVFLPKLIGSLTPTVTATASWIRGAGSQKTPSSVSLDAYSSNWVRILVSGSSLTQYQTYAVLFTALTISFS